MPVTDAEFDRACFENDCRTEYAANQAAYVSRGMTEAEFLQTRLIDQGYDSLPMIPIGAGGAEVTNALLPRVIAATSEVGSDDCFTPAEKYGRP